jgi:signal transduction histidine kinase/CheY-like chemotaxis protein/HAMP domain-containing protein
MKLQRKVLVFALPFAAVFAGLTALVGSYATESLMVRELGRRFQPQIEEFAAGMAGNLEPLRENALLARLQSAQSFSGAAFTEVLGPDGVVAAATNVLEAGKRRDDAQTRAALSSDRTVIVRRDGRRGPQLLLSTPIWRADQEFLFSGGPRTRLGTLILGLPLEATLQSAVRVGSIVAAMSAAFCLVALALMLAFVRTLLLRPVRAITDATSRVAAGNYSVEVPVLTRDEFGDLSRSFNAMGATLSQTVVSRDRLEEALAISKASLDASADGMLVIGSGKKLITCSKRFLEMWSIPEEIVEIGGENIPFAEYVRPQLQDPELFDRIMVRPDSDSAAPEQRDLLRLKDGRVFERISRPYFIGGRAMGRTLTYRDLTLHLEGLRALSQARDEALETARIKSEFLANVSHEIRTPLNAIVGSSEMLLDTRLDAAQREHASDLGLAARTLLELVNSLLDFTKIEAGRMTVEKSLLSPGVLLDDAASLLAPRAAEKGLTLTIDVDGASSLELLGDPTRLRQVLLNLLTNAVKFTDKGEVAAGISVISSDSDSVELEFSVRDTGIGIPPEQAGSIFVPFSQLDASTTRRFGGTGLGLAISRTLVELMGGTIGFEPAHGGGTRFWFRVRLARADASAPAAASPEEASPRGPSERRDRLRVLVVDDNEINRRLLQRQLDRLGCPSVSVDGGAAALDALSASDFGLILLDCQMPGLDGYATAAEIRRLEGGRRRSPIAAITANTSREVRKRCEDAGMDGFIPKPTTLNDLAAAIERWDLPFDEAALAAFAAVAADGPEGLAPLLDDFVTDAGTRLASAREALGRGDVAACGSQAHSVRGASASVGARGLAELCRLIEAAADSSESSRADVCAALLGQADAEVARLRADALRRKS